jgi:hypothetical protein
MHAAMNSLNKRRRYAIKLHYAVNPQMKAEKNKIRAIQRFKNILTPWKQPSAAAASPTPSSTAVV